MHALVAEYAPVAWAELEPEQVAGQVIVGIETDRGPWVIALLAAGQLGRYRSLKAPTSTSATTRRACYVKDRSMLGAGAEEPLMLGIRYNR